LKLSFEHKVRRVALLGNLPPRRCGIASYTADVAKSLLDARPGLELQVVAMLDDEQNRNPDPKTAHIKMHDRDAYSAVARQLNEGRFDLLHVQHEFGIFGGEAGEYLLDLMRDVNMPIVTTLHTVLNNPSPAQRRVFEEILELSERVIVMTRKGIQILQDVYNVNPEKVDFMHHGIPDANKVLGTQLRKQMGCSGPVILTFGLLGRDKGIHVMIEAMPEILQKVPTATYVIVGATHPHLVASHGESYRQVLEDQVRELGLSENVRFVNKFVTDEELAGWLGATDVYVTPYLKEEQITSGTLAYALGNGNAVVSTPYWHAAELLAEERGLFAPFGDPHGLASAITEILLDPRRRTELRERAAEYGLSMRWPSVAKQTLECFEQARQDGADQLRRLMVPPSETDTEIYAIPPVSFEYLAAMTDDTGLFQHALYRLPNRNEGYCTDDNARALMAMIMAGAPNSQYEEINRLYRTYLTFVVHAFDPVTGRFKNFMGYDRQWLESIGSDDSNGRAVWALAAAAQADQGPNGELALRIASRGCRSLVDSSYPRTWAFRILALREIGHRDREFGTRLHGLLQENGTPNWPWFENHLTYDNARLSQALILAGEDQPAMLEDGLKSLRWLMEVQTGADGCFAPIGCHGFYEKGAERAWYDQQPLEAWASVSACLTAHRVTGDSHWMNEAIRSFRWFLGANTEGIRVAEPEIGLCVDGLQREGINMNCGAESTLAYLMALLELRAASPYEAPKPREAETNGKWIPGSLRPTSP